MAVAASAMPAASGAAAAQEAGVALAGSQAGVNAAEAFTALHAPPNTASGEQLALPRVEILPVLMRGVLVFSACLGNDVLRCAAVLSANMC
jgi:hypothetical protein